MTITKIVNTPTMRLMIARFTVIRLLARASTCCVYQDVQLGSARSPHPMGCGGSSAFLAC